jgi:hypothetical protein
MTLFNERAVLARRLFLFFSREILQYSTRFSIISIDADKTKDDCRILTEHIQYEDSETSSFHDRIDDRQAYTCKSCFPLGERERESIQ